MDTSPQELTTNLENNVKETMLADIDESLHTILEELNVLAMDINLPNRQMPEHVFVRVFLPLLIGDVDNYYPGTTLANWVAFAGGPYRRVDVVNRANVTLFTVPPLLNKFAIKPITAAEFNTSDILKTFKLQNSVHPMRGHQYLNEALNHELKLLDNSEAAMNQDDIATWGLILTRYGLTHLISKSRDGEKTITAEPTLSLDYDPL